MFGLLAIHTCQATVYKCWNMLKVPCPSTASTSRWRPCKQSRNILVSCAERWAKTIIIACGDGEPSKLGQMLHQVFTAVFSFTVCVLPLLYLRSQVFFGENSKKAEFSSICATKLQVMTKTSLSKLDLKVKRSLKLTYCCMKSNP